jgi:two-component system chemotaxis response regulator CheB
VRAADAFLHRHLTETDAVMNTKDDRPWFIAVAASAGGIPALQTLLAGLPAGTRAAIAIVQHPSPAHPGLLKTILARSTAMPVVLASDGQPIESGTVYLSRCDLHLTVASDGRFAYMDGIRVRGLFSSANPLFESAARVFGDRTIGVVLTGGGRDATDGVQTVKAQGGIVIAQDPSTAEFGSMPSSAVQTGSVDLILPLSAIAPALIAIVTGQVIGGAVTG